MTNNLVRLAELGQSMWYDNIARDLLNSGEIADLINSGIRGLTSNPSIFQKAITSGSAYDEQLKALVAEGHDATAIYEELAIADIQQAADLLRPLFDETQGADGYISLEVSPLLAHDTAATLAEAKRLWERVDRPNLMIKIPATPEGIPAIEEAIAAGLNVNITLIFSRDAYQDVMMAYQKGLQRRVDGGEPIDHIASVASFFVSRVDSLVDELLDDIGTDEAKALKGKAAIANAKLAYQLFKEHSGSEAFQALIAKGAALQ
ncbi:MAG: transaldolase, partial [Chloroflexi bacterium]|nr:transaldolase [Chloroflexota bacterium]